MSTTFAEIERERAALLDEKVRRALEYGTWTAQAEIRLNELSERAAALAAGVDVARIDRARKVLRVIGDCLAVVNGRDTNCSTVRANAIADAKRWLAENPARLKEKYVGVKNYSGFGDQREDHVYGYGPRHGNIVFEIGLTHEARGRDLTPQEIEDALYLLHVLPTLAKVQKQAA